jgi:dipeptide/tripeptide permease
MSSRSVFVLVLLPLMLGAERFANNAMRSPLFVYLMHEEGERAATMSRMMAMMALGGLVGPLLAGVLALLVGPRVVALAGAALAAGGYFLLAAQGPFQVALVIVTIGVGLFKPCPWAILGDEVSREDTPSGVDTPPKSPRRFTLAAALAMLLYAATNIGAFVAPLVGGVLVSRSGSGAAFGLCGAAALACLVGTVVVAAIRPRSRAPSAQPNAQPVYRAPANMPAAAPPPSASGRGLLGLVVLFVATVPVDLASTLERSSTLPRSSWVMSLSGVVLVLASLVGFAIYLSSALARRPLPMLPLMGGALVVVIVGTVAMRIESVATFAVGLTLLAMAEPFIGSVGIAYATLSTGPRARTLVVGAWIAAGAVVSWVATAAPGVIGLDFYPGVVLVLALPLAIAAACALLVGGRRIHALFE